MLLRFVATISVLLGFCCLSFAAPAKKSSVPKKIISFTPAQEDSLYEARGFLPLRGIQSGHFERNTYVVAGDITVPENDTLEIPAGSTIMVVRLASITVKGVLVCSGSRFAPVTITMLTDNSQKEQNPDLARWKGLTIVPGGGAQLRFVLLSGSQHGLAAEKGSSVVLDSAIFSNNLYADCRLGDSTYTVTAGKPLGAIYNALPRPKDAAGAVPVQSSPLPLQNDWHQPVRITTASVAILGVGGAVFCALASDQSYREYNAARDVNSSSSAVVDKLEAQTKTLTMAAVVSGVTAALCAAGFTLTFIIK